MNSNASAAQTGTLPDELKRLEKLCLEAGELALSFWKGRPAVTRKADGTPVTEADLAVNSFMEQRLLPGTQNRGWLSEESEDSLSRIKCETVFILDPIDGTRDFICGGDHWTISIALCRAGRPVAGVVYNPVRQELYSAAKGQGSFLNGAPLAVSLTEEIEGAGLSASDGILRKPIWASPWPACSHHKINSLAYRLALVASGAVDAAFAITPKPEWDVAAGALLVEEAGGIVTLADGTALLFNKPKPRVQGFLAAGKKLHKKLLARFDARHDAGLHMAFSRPLRD
jgi:myo-inositol-1(or 4)-monophosphatase